MKYLQNIMGELRELECHAGNQMKGYTGQALIEIDKYIYITKKKK